jgi:diguanylate cyclase (GGDEF)-like protein
MNEALWAWRTREGTAMLVFYCAVIAVISGALKYVGAPLHVYAGMPAWLPLVPVATAVSLAAAVLAFPALQARAYRLQAIGVGCFLLSLTTAAAAGGNVAISLTALILCMIGMQYAFLRWEELAAAYAAVPISYGITCAVEGILLQPLTLYRLEIVLAITAICIAVGSLRLRTIYTQAQERLALERQAAELRRQTEHSARIALMDQLTGLLNRAGLSDLIDRALAHSKKNGTRTALLYVDLDGFKSINDACGHDRGDLALVEAALRMQYVLRTGETAGRIGGDEFVIVLPSVESADEAQVLAKRVEDAFTEPFCVGGQLFSLSVSIGIALSGDYAHSRATLIDMADKAMYDAKRRRKAERVLAHIGGGYRG